MFIKKNVESNGWDMSISEYERIVILRCLKGLDLDDSMNDRAEILERRIFGVVKAESNPNKDTRKSRAV